MLDRHHPTLVNLPPISREEVLVIFQDVFALANCKGVDPEFFFPEFGDVAGLRAAKAVCQGCVVREECLEFALITNEKEGVWGGLSGRARRKLRSGGNLDDFVESTSRIRRDRS